MKCELAALMVLSATACGRDYNEVIAETTITYCDHAVACDPDLNRLEQCENPWSQVGLDAAGQGDECLRRWEAVMLCAAGAPCDEVDTPLSAPSCTAETSSLLSICFPE
jgi:hypothetical protein